MKHAAIVPLIGGSVLASEEVIGSSPEYLLSYTPFQPNEEHLRNYYDYKNKEIPYILLDEYARAHEYVDVVSTICPCAGLSTLSHHSGPDNPKNDWMAITAEHVLGTIKPQVFWGENAPTFAGNTGKKIRDRIYEIGRKNGYTMSVYKTKSLLHGLPQYRGRSFYFFWKEDNKIPVLNYFNRPYKTIDELLNTEVVGNTQREVTNPKIPTQNPYYRYILDVMHPGMTHPEFIEHIDKTYELTGYIRKQGITFPQLAEYFRKNGNDKEADKCIRKQTKLDAGGGIMTRALVVPKDYTGAFVGHLPRNMTHTREDRFLSYRECMTIMGLPQDFELLNPKNNLNHVCQNVPMTTAKDMVGEVVAYLDGKRPMIDGKQLFQNNHSMKEDVWEKDEAVLTEFFA
jgi:site-specific DNA-cytosine methylase